MYPVSFEADAVLEGRNRLTTFFRYIVAIPWLIVASLYGIGAQIAAFIAWFAIVFTGRYPEGLYNFNAGYLRMISRVNGFTYLLTDDYPPFGGEEGPQYPIRVGVPPPLDQYNRMKTLFRLIIGIPVYLLIDREEGEVLVYSEPSGDDYAKGLKHKLGLAVPLPAPLGFELDTAEF